MWLNEHLGSSNDVNMYLTVKLRMKNDSNSLHINRSYIHTNSIITVYIGLIKITSLFN